MAGISDPPQTVASVVPGRDSAAAPAPAGSAAMLRDRFARVAGTTPTGYRRAFGGAEGTKAGL